MRPYSGILIHHAKGPLGSAVAAFGGASDMR
jgi:hypothetical protein